MVQWRRKVTEVHWVELLGCFKQFPLFWQRKSKRMQQQRLRDSNQGYRWHGRKNNALSSQGPYLKPGSMLFYLSKGLCRCKLRIELGEIIWDYLGVANISLKAL